MARQQPFRGDAGRAKVVALSADQTGAPAAFGLDDGPDIVIPLLVEDAVIEKRRFQTGAVRVSLTTTQHERRIDEELTHERIVVERVPVGRVVEIAPPVREEGDTTILSVVEEVLVLERRLVLKEEVRIKRVRTTETHHETVQLREQFATVSRSNAAPAHTANLPTANLKETI